MITGAVKNKVDKIWLDIFSAGLANPLTVIEQLTYLMFVRALDVKELENERYEALGMKVTYLKRLSMGSLTLDEALAPGEFRELTDIELQALTRK